MEEADIVVVGGGSGGAAAAGRLSEGGRYSVAILEAGGANDGIRTLCPGFMAFQTPATNWQYETVPQAGLNGRRGYQPRGKGMGGSSAINAMLYIRGNAWDYDRWATLGATGWSWSEVLPYFKRAEHNVNGADAWHGANGPLWVSNQEYAHPGARDFIEAARRLQIPVNQDFNGATQEGVGLYQVTQKGGERWTSARAYLADAKSRPKLNILTDVLAERVLFEDGRATGVAYQRGGAQRVIRARRAVVLAGGVFGTPQLLMLSGIGGPAQLADHGIPVRIARDEVGQNLQDHVDYVASFETPGTAFMGRSLKGSINVAHAILRWKWSRSGLMTTPYAEAGGFLTVTPGAPAPDVQLHFVIAPLEDHGRVAVKAHGYSCHVCVLRPESAGSVTLASADPRAAPLIDPAFLSDDRDMTVLKAGVRAMYRILETPPLADHQGKDRYPIDLADDEALEHLIRSRADTVYHPVGTARMGSDEAAVCDPRLRVRGVDGLYVADASVMPKLVSGNTNAPSIMIGERCADFICSDLG
ncbi:choline dehydrogenase-like flavoprotein [Hephaestia caeni]|uniref:Choline dehydrogenase-like flavoprotein n=1 Tax=Hephaestia caeni TaxID=645617 RepID=A0A397P2V5_9SPHN|nr:GMC family oxidoreductase N-terminal domain-containing protein [Hephaestia caeni]RIA43916.1 choline dehydrogenase-like flavoprotein [Hephaestia caeni]